jgi:predicted DNA-binding transcriptional regulator AlpA
MSEILPETSPRFLSKTQVCRRFGVSESTLSRAVRQNRFPSPVNLLGSRRVGWRIADIEDHEAHKAVPA